MQRIEFSSEEQCALSDGPYGLVEQGGAPVGEGHRGV